MYVTPEPLSKERPMKAKEFLAYIVHEVHTAIVATGEDGGFPVAAAIDMMDSGEGGLRFQ